MKTDRILKFAFADGGGLWGDLPLPGLLIIAIVLILYSRSDGRLVGHR